MSQMTESEFSQRTAIEDQVLAVCDKVGDPLMSHFYDAINEPREDIVQVVRDMVKRRVLKMKEDLYDHDWSYSRR